MRKQAVENLERGLKEAREHLVGVENELKSLPKAQPPKATHEVTEKITNAEVINKQAAAYDAYQTKAQEYEVVESSLADNRQAQAKAVNARLAYIQEHDFGFDGLEVDEDGRLQEAERWAANSPNQVEQVGTQTGEAVADIDNLHKAKREARDLSAPNVGVVVTID